MMTFVPMPTKLIADHTYYHAGVILDEDGSAGRIIFEDGPVKMEAESGRSYHGPWLLCPDLTVARRMDTSTWLCRHQLTVVDVSGQGWSYAPVHTLPPPPDEHNDDDLKCQARIPEILATELNQLMFGDAGKTEPGQQTTAGEVRATMRLAVALYQDIAPRLRYLDDRVSSRAGHTARQLMPTAAFIASMVLPEPFGSLAGGGDELAERLWRQFLTSLSAAGLGIGFGRVTEMPAGVYPIDLEDLPTGNLYQELGAWIYRIPQETTP